jgi:hypothetical protein
MVNAVQSEISSASLIPSQASKGRKKPVPSWTYSAAKEKKVMMDGSFFPTILSQTAARNRESGNGCQAQTLRNALRNTFATLVTNRSINIGR